MTDDDMNRLFELDAMMKEPLTQELVPYVQEDEFWGKVLRHPLVIDFGVNVPGHINRMYEHKKATVREALAEGNWGQYLWLHAALNPQHRFRVVKRTYSQETEEVLEVKVTTRRKRVAS